MLWFVRTHDKENGGDNFWIALADTPGQLKEMFEDEYTELVDFTDDITAGIIEQYGGLALLSTP